MNILYWHISIIKKVEVYVWTVMNTKRYTTDNSREIVQVLITSELLGSLYIFNLCISTSLFYLL